MFAKLQSQTEPASPHHRSSLIFSFSFQRTTQSHTDRARKRESQFLPKLNSLYIFYLPVFKSQQLIQNVFMTCIIIFKSNLELIINDKPLWLVQPCPDFVQKMFWNRCVLFKRRVWTCTCMHVCLQLLYIWIAWAHHSFSGYASARRGWYLWGEGVVQLIEQWLEIQRPEVWTPPRAEDKFVSFS